MSLVEWGASTTTEVLMAGRCSVAHWGLVLWLPCCLADLQECRCQDEQRPGCQQQRRPHLASCQLSSCKHLQELRHLQESDGGEHP